MLLIAVISRFDELKATNGLEWQEYKLRIKSPVLHATCIARCPFALRARQRNYFCKKKLWTLQCKMGTQGWLWRIEKSNCNWAVEHSHLLLVATDAHCKRQQNEFKFNLNTDEIYVYFLLQVGAKIMFLTLGLLGLGSTKLIKCTNDGLSVH